MVASQGLRFGMHLASDGGYLEHFFMTYSIPSRDILDIWRSVSAGLFHAPVMSLRFERHSENVSYFSIITTRCSDASMPLKP